MRSYKGRCGIHMLRYLKEELAEAKINEVISNIKLFKTVIPPRN